MAGLSDGVLSTEYVPTVSTHIVHTKDEDQPKLQDQTKLLSGWPLIRVFANLSTAQFVSFMDQVAIGMLIPSIEVDIQAKDDIAWLGTASLMGMTAFSPLWGRGSDLLGRKNCLLVLLVVLGVASLGCAVAQDFGLMCASRVFAGIANGGISSLVQTMVSDHVTLQQRSKYQGILGTMVGAGSVVGVLSSSLLDMHSSWRHQYYLQCGLVTGVFAVCWTYLPSYKPTMNFRKIFEEFDKEGLLAIIAAVVLILVATSQGGRPETPWNSPTIIVLYTTGVLCFLTFLTIEWRWAKLPIVPLRMLGNRSVAAMLGQTFLLGASYQINSYYLQLYLQNVHDYTPFKGALLQMSRTSIEIPYSCGPENVLTKSFSASCTINSSTSRRPPPKQNRQLHLHPPLRLRHMDTGLWPPHRLQRTYSPSTLLLHHHASRYRHWMRASAYSRGAPGAL